MKKVNESSEAWMRIPVGIVSGIVLSAFEILAFVLSFINFFHTIIFNKRHKEMAEFCEIWNTQTYVYVKYMVFVTNERPFPFKKMTKNMSKYQK